MHNYVKKRKITCGCDWYCSQGMWSVSGVFTFFISCNKAPTPLVCVYVYFYVIFVFSCTIFKNFFVTKEANNNNMKNIKVKIICTISLKCNKIRVKKIAHNIIILNIHTGIVQN